MKTTTQNQQVLKYLLTGNRITPLQALDYFGCFRLGARIYDLKKLGYDIKSQNKKVGKDKYVAEYYIHK